MLANLISPILDGTEGEERKMKQVIDPSNRRSMMMVTELNESMIIIFKSHNSLYHAHRSAENKWSFISLWDSRCHANGFFNSLQELLENTIKRDREEQNIFVLDDIFEIVKLR